LYFYSFLWWLSHLNYAYLSLPILFLIAHLIFHYSFITLLIYLLMMLQYLLFFHLILSIFTFTIFFIYIFFSISVLMIFICHTFIWLLSICSLILDIFVIGFFSMFFEYLPQHYDNDVIILISISFIISMGHILLENH
jgi:hypothetical protein